MARIPYISDAFLDEFKTNFDDKYLHYYEQKSLDSINAIFTNEKNIKYTLKEFDYKPLLKETENENATSRNIRILWESLNHLTVSEAENEKLWVALENTFYLDYHMDQLSMVTKDKIKARTVFTRTKKRSLVMNNLSLLWWIGYFMYDDKTPSAPFRYSDYFVKGTYRGNALAFLSSNIVSNREIVIGIMEGIMQLVSENKMIENRYSYTNSNKLLNQIGGVRVIDNLERDEITEIIVANLLDMEKTKLPQKNIEHVN